MESEQQGGRVRAPAATNNYGQVRPSFERPLRKYFAFNSRISNALLANDYGIPKFLATKAQLSAAASISLVTGVPAPCPDRVSIRISTGADPV